MAKNKRTPKQQMKRWVIGGIAFKARTQRVAMRRFLKGNYAHERLVVELELVHPCEGRGIAPAEAARIWKGRHKRLKGRARARMSSARREDVQ